LNTLSNNSMNADSATTEFPLREAQALVRPLMTPNPWIYWTDFLFHVGLGWFTFFYIVSHWQLTPWTALAYIVATLCVYRAGIFVHELAHLKKGTFRLFRVVWNLICGIPLLIPSFTYDGVHNHHHKRDAYGTAEDGEYLHFTGQRPIYMVGYVLLSFILPWLAVIRFLVLTPLGWLIPPLGRLIWARASSLTIDAAYNRPANAIRNDTYWRLEEAGAFLFAAVVAWGFVSGVLPLRALALWYAITTLVFILNSLRTLAAHAYRNDPSHHLSVVEQYLDSINVPGNPLLTPLWAPVGLRMHATHHLFPAMPYHNLLKAHRLLVDQLSDNTLYVSTLRSSLWDALRKIWGEAAANTRGK
jgi:fatty acid desaturase